MRHANSQQTSGRQHASKPPHAARENLQGREPQNGNSLWPAADLGAQYPRIVLCLEGPQLRMEVRYSVNSGRISHFPHFPPQHNPATASITPASQLAEPLFQCYLLTITDPSTRLCRLLTLGRARQG